MGVFDRTLVTGSEGGSSKVFEQPVRLVNSDGSDFAGGGSAYTLPAATKDALGGVKLAEFGNAIGNASESVAAAAGETPTKAEFDALQAAHNDLAKQFNRLVSGLSTSGAISKPSA